LTRPRPRDIFKNREHCRFAALWTRCLSASCYIAIIEIEPAAETAAADNQKESLLLSTVC
jgi:hypothetical protein